MKKFSRALSFVMTLAMLLSGIAVAEQQYFNNGGGGEFVDPHTFTKPYTVNEVIVPADEATGQVELEAHVKNIIEVDGLKFKGFERQRHAGRVRRLAAACGRTRGRSAQPDDAG